MNTQEVSMKEVLEGCPKWARFCLGLFLSAFLSYQLTGIILICTGDSVAILLQWQGVLIVMAMLLIFSGIGLATRRILVVSFVFAGLLLIYCVYSLRYAYQLSLETIRMYIFYAMPPIFNGILLTHSLNPLA